MKPLPDRATQSRVVSVLPPREQFRADAAGAISLLVHRMARSGDVVIGAPLGSGQALRGPVFLAAGPTLWPPFGPLRYAAAVARVLLRLRPSLIEVHNRPEIALALARRFPDIPLVLILHNDPHAMRRARSAAERSAILRVMPVFTVSHWLRARFLDGVDAHAAHPVIVCANAIDMAALPPLAPARANVVLFVGRVVADKGADCFVRACSAVLAHHPHWQAQIIGADRFGPDSPGTAFLTRVQQMAEGSPIALRGYCPHDEVLRAMRRAAIVIVPSRWAEPFGMSALEAMASGAALITTPNGALPEVAGDAALYADPDAPGALEEALRRLVEDASLRFSLAQAGIERAWHFDVNIVRATLDHARAAVIALWE